MSIVQAQPRCFGAACDVIITTSSLVQNVDVIVEVRRWVPLAPASATGPSQQKAGKHFSWGRKGPGNRHPPLQCHEISGISLCCFIACLLGLWQEMSVFSSHPRQKLPWLQGPNSAHTKSPSSQGTQDWDAESLKVSCLGFARHLLMLLCSPGPGTAPEYQTRFNWQHLVLTEDKWEHHPTLCRCQIWCLLLRARALCPHLRQEGSEGVHAWSKAPRKQSFGSGRNRRQGLALNTPYMQILADEHLVGVSEAKYL